MLFPLVFQFPIILNFMFYWIAFVFNCCCSPYSIPGSFIVSKLQRMCFLLTMLHSSLCSCYFLSFQLGNIYLDCWLKCCVQLNFLKWSVNERCLNELLFFWNMITLMDCYVILWWSIKRKWTLFIMKWYDSPAQKWNILIIK